MADIREEILAQLLVIAQGIEGIKYAVRNAQDVPMLTRPAIILHDGHEELDTQVGRPDFKGRLQYQTLNPQFYVFFSSNTKDIGTVASLFRQRLLVAVFNDPTLMGLIVNKQILYQGCTLVPPEVTEARETRLEIELILTYIFRIDDLS